MSGAVVRSGGSMVSLAPQSFQEALAFANQVAQTDMVPESDRNKPGNVLAKIQFGAEIGLPPFQSIQKLFCTKGRVGMEVSAMQAVVEASGLCDDLDVTWDEATQMATATTTRKGRKPATLMFSVEDAKRAGLMTKALYSQYPQRMLTRRALGFLLQDRYPDVLRGVVHLEQLYEIAEADEAKPLPQGPVVALLPVGAEVDPAVQAKLTEAFELCHLNPGQRIAKLAEYRGREDELLDWLRSEYAARQGKKVKPAGKLQGTGTVKHPAPLALVPAAEVPVAEAPKDSPAVVARMTDDLAAATAGEALVSALDSKFPVPILGSHDLTSGTVTPDLFGDAPSPEELFR